MASKYKSHPAGSEKVLHQFVMPGPTSAKLRMISMSRSKLEVRNVSMTEIVNTAVDEYFANHKEEIRNALAEYQAKGRGFLTTLEKEFYE